MARVLSSSPHKSSLPSTSKEEPRAAEEEEDEDEDTSLLAVPLAPQLRVTEEEEIDDSLLAAVMMPEPEAGEEEEIDDASLLAVEMMPQSKVKEEQQVDYLEGMTAEMFGNDDEFDQCDIDNEEEEVEALPDAHFGLLGSRSGLLKPQGCMDDLPEEVLREVLCLLPAQDLYLNVRLVCHRWRNIVQDSTVR